MRFETRYLQNFLENLDDLVDTAKISHGEYIQIGLLLKICEILTKKDPLR